MIIKAENMEIIRTSSAQFDIQGQLRIPNDAGKDRHHDIRGTVTIRTGINLSDREPPNEGTTDVLFNIEQRAFRTGRALITVFWLFDLSTGVLSFRSARLEQQIRPSVYPWSGGSKRDQYNDLFNEEESQICREFLPYIRQATTAFCIENIDKLFVHWRAR